MTVTLAVENEQLPRTPIIATLVTRGGDPNSHTTLSISTAGEPLLTGMGRRSIAKIDAGIHIA